MSLYLRLKKMDFVAKRFQQFVMVKESLIKNIGGNMLTKTKYIRGNE